MNTTHQQTAEDKKKKKQARKEIDAFFRQIKAACKHLKSFEETMKQVEKIRPTLQRFQEVPDPTLVKDVTAVLDQIDRATAKGDQLCDLSDRLKALNASLYNPAIPHWVQDLTPAGWGGVVGGAVTVVILAGGLVTAFSPFFQATIDISNQGCQAIQPPKGIPQIPGVTLWTEPIQDGQHGQAKLPPYLQIGLDATQPDTLALSFFNTPVVNLYPSGLKSLTLNGKEIIGTQKTQTTAVLGVYSLVLTCH